MIFSSETCNLPYHCGQQIRQNPSVSSTMLAVTPPLGEKRKVYSFEFEKNKKLEKFGKKQNTKQLERYSFGISQSRPSSWQSLGKSYFSILHRYSWYQKANLKISLRSTQEAQEISLQGPRAPKLDRTYQCRSRMWLVLGETAKNTHKSIRQIWPL